MSKDISEMIDDMCESYYGHNHWAFKNTLSERELKDIRLDKLADIMPSIVFYEQDRREEDE